MIYGSETLWLVKVDLEARFDSSGVSMTRCMCEYTFTEKMKHMELKELLGLEPVSD